MLASFVPALDTALMLSKAAVSQYQMLSMSSHWPPVESYQQIRVYGCLLQASLHRMGPAAPLT